jgi:hypothetical protein
MKPDDGKLRELILYIARHSENDPRFTKTKLFKILFYSDFEGFAETGRAITGQRYKRLPHGPVPTRALELLEYLEETGEVEMVSADPGGMTLLRPAARREPHLDLFTPEELRRVDAVIERLWENTADEVSALSHEFLGWKTALPNEVIPYETALISSPPLTNEEETYVATLTSRIRRQ